ncbi:hypothetical protein K470DRAFT_264017 [Piedraia hortae CBS 480.64]|uniref:Uncharacterized protein n=1 Tax=Piedraia hortae CBS 480.64 TaxID=1314780 RepID=A0A6A7C199_9PEZI|nr:hypothetical protein K470DRAFT_264017 [Piedraia hortae CBS 480.64]
MTSHSFDDEEALDRQLYAMFANFRAEELGNPEVREEHHELDERLERECESRDLTDGVEKGELLCKVTTSEDDFIEMLTIPILIDLQDLSSVGKKTGLVRKQVLGDSTRRIGQRCSQEKAHVFTIRILKSILEAKAILVGYMRSESVIDLTVGDDETCQNLMGILSESESESGENEELSIGEPENPAVNDAVLSENGLDEHEIEENLCGRLRLHTLSRFPASAMKNLVDLRLIQRLPLAVVQEAFPGKMPAKEKWDMLSASVRPRTLWSLTEIKGVIRYFEAHRLSLEATAEQLPERSITAIKKK